MYRDGGGGLALSVYIRKLSFSPTISSHICIIVTIPSKLQLVKDGFYLTMGKVSNSKKMSFLNCLSSSSSSSSG